MHLKRVVQLVSISITLTLIGLFRGLISPDMQSGSLQAGGFEDTMINPRLFTSHTTLEYTQSANDKQPATQQSTKTAFNSGFPALGSNYSMIVVIPRLEKDDVTWISTEIPMLDVSIFVVDDPSTESHPPKNKGHEVMIYLSYLIDHYDSLPDIILFMHAHRWTHHNNRILGFDASQMISSLNGAHVIREGYVNMRCHWSPGCPEWLRPTSVQDTLGKQEETVLERCWHELFPFDPIPLFLAQPCCSQFALSRDRIRSIPRSRYVFYRDWILKTPLSDYVSGRIWEYSWQYLFTKDSVDCPAEHVCYCNAFNFCFGTQSAYEQFLDLLDHRTKLQEDLETQDQGYQAHETSNGLGYNETSARLTMVNAERHIHIEARIAQVDAEIVKRRREARSRGAEPCLVATKC